METAAFSSWGALNAGQDAIADASEAQEAKMGFLGSESDGVPHDFPRVLKTFPGCISAVKSKTLSYAVVGRMVASISDD